MPDIEEDDFLTKIQYLNDNYDESDLSLHFFKTHFRCKSFNQSYNILDSQEYLNVDKALQVAEALLLKLAKKRPPSEEKKS
mmetsp:Transcript_16236/g.25115  ORF Transcript_16236/g.25115 Transcript_16236/m.25115 type:complete len:81 (+) Transcript_16236:1032-1274(+)